MLTDRHIRDFQHLYLTHFGEEITRERAVEEGIRLMRFVALINNLNINVYEHRNTEKGN